MGYSHQWRISGTITPTAWLRITTDTTKLITAFGPSLLCRAADSDLPPLVDSDSIQFNGRYPAGLEDFLLVRRNGRGFCKTEWLDYDRLVCAVLAVVAEHYWAFALDSDGSRAAWTPHIEWASGVLQRVVPNPLVASEI